MNRPLDQHDGGVTSAATTGAFVAPRVGTAVTLRGRLADYWELCKPRISVMVLVVTAIGYGLGSVEAVRVLGLLSAVFGTALVAVGANIINQVMERDFDRLMRRTRQRPIPSGRLTAAEATAFGGACAVMGLVYLLLVVNPLSAVLAGITIALYLLVYTPAKRRTIHNTLIGAVPGALPPMIGYAAARGELTPAAWALFAILFVWQLPHFFAIAWMYRDDYARGGYRMLPSADLDGRRTGRWIVGYSIVLLAVSLAPWALQMAGVVYAVVAAVLGVGLLAVGWGCLRERSEAAARRMLLASIIYLPVLFFMLWINRVGG